MDNMALLPGPCFVRKWPEWSTNMKLICRLCSDHNFYCLLDHPSKSKRIGHSYVFDMCVSVVKLYGYKKILADEVKVCI